MRVLFIDSVHEILEQRLLGLGWTCDHDYKSPYSEIRERIAEYDGMVIRSRIPVDAALIQAATNLKFIARSGAGLENIDLAAAAERKVAVVSSPEGNRDAVGEHAIGMLLMLLNHLKRADAEVRQGVWLRAENRGSEIAGRTIGILGYGQMGSAFAEKLSGFGCKVIAYDKYRTPKANDWGEAVDLATLQREADVISLHLPETEETRHYINDAFIAACSKSFVLINTARGMNVDTAALVRGLESGAVSGACLDVLEFEQRSFEGLSADALPDAFRYLIHSDRVILSPHIAGWTHESYVKLSSVLADKLERLFGQG